MRPEDVHKVRAQSWSADPAPLGQKALIPLGRVAGRVGHVPTAQPAITALLSGTHGPMSQYHPGTNVTVPLVHLLTTNDITVIRAGMLLEYMETKG